MTTHRPLGPVPAPGRVVLVDRSDSDGLATRLPYTVRVDYLGEFRRRDHLADVRPEQRLRLPPIVGRRHSRPAPPGQSRLWRAVSVAAPTVDSFDAHVDPASHSSSSCWRAGICRIRMSLLRMLGPLCSLGLFCDENIPYRDW